MHITNDSIVFNGPVSLRFGHVDADGVGGFCDEIKLGGILFFLPWCCCSSVEKSDSRGLYGRSK